MRLCVGVQSVKWECPSCGPIEGLIPVVAAGEGGTPSKYAAEISQLHIHALTSPKGPVPAAEGAVPTDPTPSTEPAAPEAVAHVAPVAAPAPAPIPTTAAPAGPVAAAVRKVPPPPPRPSGDTVLTALLWLLAAAIVVLLYRKVARAVNEL